MPIPDKSKETKDEYLSRCIPEVIKKGKERDQAVAICNSFWDKEINASAIQNSIKINVVAPAPNPSEIKITYVAAKSEAAPPSNFEKLGDLIKEIIATEELNNPSLIFSYIEPLLVSANLKVTQKNIFLENGSVKAGWKISE